MWTVRSRGSVRLHAEPDTKEASTGSATSAEDQGDAMDLVSHCLAVLVTNVSRAARTQQGHHFKL